MFDKKAFATRLRELRKEKDWTIRGAAEKCGIAPSTYSAYESKTSTKTPPLDVAVQIAEGYGITLNELCGMEAKLPEAPKAVEPPAEDRVYSCAEVARLLMEFGNQEIININSGLFPAPWSENGSETYTGINIALPSETLRKFFTTEFTLRNLQIEGTADICKTWEDAELKKLEMIYLHGNGKEDENPR